MKVDISADAFRVIQLVFPFRGECVSEDCWRVDMPDHVYWAMTDNLQPGQTLSLALIQGALSAVISQLKEDGLSAEQMRAWFAERGIDASILRPS